VGEFFTNMLDILSISH